MTEHEPKLVHHHKKKKGDNFWMIASIVLAVTLVVSVFTNGFNSFGGLSEQEASDAVVSYIESNVDGANVEAKEVIDAGDFYAVKINLNGEEVESFLSKDGKMLFPYAIPLEETANDAEEEKTEPKPEPKTEVEKSDKPKVELFVMSHCPFGTQAEKGIIPAVQELGDTIDFSVEFVYYVMHGEKEVVEQTNQYCIQKEQNDKFLLYLECFLTEGEGEACIAEVGVDVEKMEACVEAADEEFALMENLEDKDKWLNGRFPRFNTAKKLNEKYGVGGSPTLVINGAQVKSSRDSASFLSAICDAFNEAPEACSAELSSANPSSGFGYGTTATADSAQCS